MTSSSHSRRRAIAFLTTASACWALLLAGGAATSLARATGADAAGAPACAVTSIEVWLGDGEGGGTAGTTYFPLEFSNIGHAACGLIGYPGVSVFGSNVKQIGKPATQSGASHTLVVLAPGATAHALLGIHDAGAICKPVSALGLRVYAPGQKVSMTIPFSLQACASASVLTVGPIRAGVGIPGYTTS